MNLWNLWGREPAMVVALVQGVIVLGVAFGLRLTAEQTGAILALTAVVLGLITRSQVDSPATSLERAARAYDLGLQNGGKTNQAAAVLATFQHERVGETR